MNKSKLLRDRDIAIILSTIHLSKREKRTRSTTYTVTLPTLLLIILAIALLLTSHLTY